MKDNAQQLAKLSQIFNIEKIISPQDIEDVLKAFVVILANNKKSVDQLSEETKQEAKDLFNKIVDEVAKQQKLVDQKVEMIGETKSEMDLKMSKMISDCKDLIEEAKLTMPKDGEPGQDADEEKIVADVLAQIKLPDQFILAGKGEEIVNEINVLPTDEDFFKIDVSHIKGLIKQKGGGTAVVNRLAWYDETTLVTEYAQKIKFQGAGVQISQDSEGSLIVTVAGGSGTFADETMTDSGAHTAFTILHTPNAGTLLIINESTGQAIPTSSYSQVGTTITFGQSQEIDDGAGNLVVPVFRARYSY